jgi:hypothetical protein
MNVINCRTPYSIVINETGQVGARIKIFVWNNPSSQPTTASYTMEKKVVSSTNTSLNFNISSVLAGYITQLNPVIGVYPSAEQNKMWCNVVVQRFADYGTGWVLIDSIQAISVYGYNDYSDGYNFISTNFYKALTDSDQTIYYNLNKDIPYVNFVVDHTGANIKALYTDGVNSTNFDITTSGLAHRIYNFKIPIVDTSAGYQWQNCKLTIYNATTAEQLYIYNSVNLCEPKYEPINVAFVNKYGGWQFLTFFKASSSSMSAKGTDYNLLPDQLNYNTYRGQFKRFNLNGTEKIKCNSGWVDENYKEIFKQLLLSETILLEGQPVKVVTQDLELKSHLNERNINYQIEFEYAFNLVNNVV